MKPQRVRYPIQEFVAPAIGLLVIMLGAIQKKIFVWHIKFWASNGWNYDVMLVVMNLVIIFTGGGRYALWI
jgi:putative oxidoreductase